MNRRQLPFRLREARPDDVPALAALHVATFAEAHGGGHRSPSRELRESQWRTAFEREADWFCYVAEAPGGQLIGFAKGTLHDGGVPGFQGELDKIYVLREWHRQGIGRALVEQVGRRFLSQGVTSMLLFGDARNPSNGFTNVLVRSDCSVPKASFTAGMDGAICIPSSRARLTSDGALGLPAPSRSRSHSRHSLLDRFAGQSRALGSNVTSSCAC